jgi:hypothetical protein
MAPVAYPIFFALSHDFYVNTIFMQMAGRDLPQINSICFIYLFFARRKLPVLTTPTAASI